MERINKTCHHCGKPIRKFKTRKDWGDRLLHLKCWKFLKEETDKKEREEKRRESLKNKLDEVLFLLDCNDC